jgi:hypothetical protein
MKGSCCSYDLFLLLAAAAAFLNGIRMSVCHDCFEFFLWEADTLETYYHFDTTACLLDAQRHRGVRFFYWFFLLLELTDFSWG